MFAGFDDLEDGQPVPFAVCHGEPGRGDGLRGFAVEMTTAGEACPKRIEKIGGLARQGRMAAHVFEQEQAALRLEHATQFTQAAQGFRAFVAATRTMSQLSSMPNRQVSAG